MKKVFLWFSFFFFFSFFLLVFSFSFSKFSFLFKVQELKLVFENKSDGEDLEIVPFQFKSLQRKVRLQKNLKERLQVFKERYLWQVSLSDISRSLKRNKEVKHVFVSRKFPNRFHIIVQIYVPVLALLDEKGEVHLITEEAHFLPFSKGWNVPILRGEEFVRDVSLRKKAVKLLMSFPVKGLLSRFFISEIWIDRGKDFVLFFDSLDIEVRLGGHEFALRSHLAQFVLNYLNSRNLQGRVIDVRFSKKVVVSLSNPS